MQEAENMGYFSNLALEFNVVKNDFAPSNAERLRRRLDYLQQCLEELDAIRPHDPMHQLFDFYFYADHCTEEFEDPTTVQGFLSAIRLVEEQLIEEEQKAQPTYLSVVPPMAVSCNHTNSAA